MSEDVLGFSNLISQSKAGGVEVRAIHDLLKVVHKPTAKSKRRPAFEHKHLRRVAITAKVNDDGLLGIFIILRDLSF